MLSFRHLAQGTAKRQRKQVTYREASDSDDDSETEDETDSDAPAPRARAARASPSASRGQGSESDADAEAGGADSDDEHEPYCRFCDDGGDIICCDRCPASYHLGCLSPPLAAAPEGEWLCPSCVNPLAEVERILDVRTVAPSAATSPRLQKEFYVKFRDRSYRECSWVRRAELLAAGRRFPGILTRLRNFEAGKGRDRAVAAPDDADSGLEDEGDGGVTNGVRAEWLLVERVIASRTKRTGEVQYFCKWQNLDYSECTWEQESTLADFQAELAAFRARGAIDPGEAGTAARGKRPRQREAQAASSFEHLTATPSCLAGGSLHPYQLVGVNWLLNAHAAGNHVILADEMVRSTITGVLAKR